MKYFTIIIALLLASSTALLAQDFMLEQEFRSGSLKTNLLLRDGSWEVYGLLSGSLFELEAGPRFYLWHFTLTPRLGAVYTTDLSEAHFQSAANLFFACQRFRLLMINELRFTDGLIPSGTYYEGWATVDLAGITNRCELGLAYEHYQHNDKGWVWVIGPMFVHTWPPGSLLRKISLWTGLSDNPTIGINVTLMKKW